MACTLNGSHIARLVDVELTWPGDIENVSSGSALPGRRDGTAHPIAIFKPQLGLPDLQLKFRLNAGIDCSGTGRIVQYGDDCNQQGREDSIHESSQNQTWADLFAGSEYVLVMPLFHRSMWSPVLAVCPDRVKQSLKKMIPVLSMIAILAFAPSV